MASGKESVVKVTNSEEKKKALDAAIAKSSVAARFKS